LVDLLTCWSCTRVRVGGHGSGGHGYKLRTNLRPRERSNEFSFGR
jgi:hypothetical protein